MVIQRRTLHFVHLVRTIAPHNRHLFFLSLCSGKCPILSKRISLIGSRTEYFFLGPDKAVICLLSESESSLAIGAVEAVKAVTEERGLPLFRAISGGIWFSFSQTHTYL